MKKIFFLIGVAIILGSITASCFSDVEEVDSEYFNITEDNPRYGYYKRGLLWRHNTLTVCWQNPSASDKSDRDLVREVISDTWEKVSALRFIGWGHCESGSRYNIRIFTADKNPYSNGIGRQVNNNKKGILLNFTFDKWCRWCKRIGDKVDQGVREHFIRTIAIHEFGHAIGLVHEHNRPDRHDDCEAKKQGSNGDVIVGGFDRDSIMNYCYGSTGNGMLSDTDIFTIKYMYGNEHKKDVACIYQHANFGGRTKCYGSGDTSVPSLKNESIRNDTVSSVKIFDSNYELVLYEHSKYRGSKKTYSGITSERYVGKAFNDKASSLEIYRKF